VMIAAGLLAVVSLVLSQLFIFQSQRQKAAEVRANYNMLKMNVQSAAADPAAVLESSLASTTTVSNPFNTTGGSTTTGGTPISPPNPTQ